MLVSSKIIGLKSRYTLAKHTGRIIALFRHALTQMLANEPKTSAKCAKYTKIKNKLL